jgi:hypothetical protein
MGAGASTQAPECGSANLKVFVDCFNDMAVPGDGARAARVHAWQGADPNGNGQCSLAEIDGWIQKTLINYKISLVPEGGDIEEAKKQADDIWKCYRPSYIRAFNDAKDIGKDKAIKGIKATEDDYVNKSEFRLLNAYLCIYATMFDAFSLVDGKQGAAATAGGNTDAEDDRRISKEEWAGSFEKVKAYGFVGLSQVTDPEAAFKEMDADGKGMVLLGEWCRWIEQKEQAAGTEWGKMLAAGDDQK